MEVWVGNSRYNYLNWLVNQIDPIAIADSCTINGRKGSASPSSALFGVIGDGSIALELAHNDKVSPVKESIWDSLVVSASTPWPMVLLVGWKGRSKGCRHKLGALLPIHCRTSEGL